MESIGVASGCAEQEAGVASGCVVRRYIDFLILLIPTPLVSVLFCCSIPTFCSFFVVYTMITVFVSKNLAEKILYLCLAKIIRNKIVKLLPEIRSAE